MIHPEENITTQLILSVMTEGTGKVEEAAERLGEAMGSVLRLGIGLVQSFGDGLSKGLQDRPPAEASPAPAPAEAAADQPK